MDFDFTAEQKMLATTVSRCLSDAGTLRLGKDGSCSRMTREDLTAVAGELGKLGVLGLLVPEEHDGLGLGVVDALAAAIEAGHLATPFPFLETIVGTSYLSRALPDHAHDLLAGKTLATCASEAQLTMAAPGSVTGSIVAPYLQHADWVLAPVRLAGGASHVAIFEVATLDVEETPSLDLTSPLGEARLARPVKPDALIAGDIERTLGVLACGDLTGAADECLNRSVAYMKTRVQFDSVIGTNQALKHIAADDYVLVESMRAAAQYAAWAHDVAADPNAPDARHEADLAFHVAKAYCSAKAKKVAEDAIQIHGGIGFTWEQGLHVFLRRIQRLSGAFGSAYHHNSKLADMAIASAQTRLTAGPFGLSDGQAAAE